MGTDVFSLGTPFCGSWLAEFVEDFAFLGVAGCLATREINVLDIVYRRTWRGGNRGPFNRLPSWPSVEGIIWMSREFYFMWNAG